MNWLLLFVIVLLNSVFCLFQYWTQQIDLRKGRIQARGSIIPGTAQKFLHWQDFHTQTWGDLVGLPGVFYGYITLNSTLNSAPILINATFNASVLHSLFLLLIIIVSIAFYLRMCLNSSHKPDWEYPRSGAISPGGFAHLIYFGIMCAMAMVCFLGMIFGILRGTNLLVTLIGGGIWITAFIADVASNHFEPRTPDRTW